MFNVIVPSLVLLSLLILQPAANASSLRGEVGAQLDYFADEPMFNDQSNRQAYDSFTAELSYKGKLNSTFDVVASLFGRYSAEATDPRWGDLRELRLSYYGSQLEVSAGVLMERWGVLEAQNIVDILNPRDRVEDFQGHTKLGIPGAQIAYLYEQGRVDMWLLPYSREERLAEEKDRFRTTALPLSDAVFEEEQNTLTAAARISHMWETVELALSHYNGHARSPYFTPNLDGIGSVISLQPNYAKIEQTGLELLWINGQSLVKLESFHQSSNSDNFSGLGMGLEREFPSLGSGKASLTLYGEYYYDERNPAAAVPLAPFQNDVFIGLRLAQNNLSSTEYQIRLTHDLDSHSSLWDLRAETRINRQWFVEAVLNKFIHTAQDPALQAFENDSKLSVNLVMGF